MAAANVLQMVGNVADRFTKCINQWTQGRVKAIADNTLYGFLIKYSLAMKINGFCFLLVGLWNPFWYDTTYGLSTSEMKPASGNDLNSLYNTGLMWWVQLYETIGLLLAAGCVISLLEKYFPDQLIIGKLSSVCSILDGPFVLAGCIIYFVQTMNVHVYLGSTCIAGFLLLPSGMLEIRELLQTRND